LRDFLKEVNPEFDSFLKLVTTLTLVVENFFSQIGTLETTCQLPWSLHIYLHPPFTSH